MAGSGFQYRAFISYSHQDAPWADWLHKALETYAIPKRLVGLTTAAGTIPKRLAPIFRDREELASATDLSRKVDEALERSANLIVICSPRSAQSHWVDQEVLAFKRLGRAERIFCLIVDGEPNASGIAGREAEECFADALRFTLDANRQPTHERTEPIAADVRPGKDGKTNAKLKLIAGLLDVGFDRLRQREQQRRTRRWMALAAVAFSVMLLTTILAITAIIARNAAERRQKQAETLVGFMLGDLSDKLGEVHRLDIMQAVDDQAMAYFASLPTADVTDEALAQRATALQKIGIVRSDQGRMPDALEAYRSASAIDAELLHRAPRDVTREAAYADSLKWIGQIYFYQGDLDHALQNFKGAGGILQKAIAAKPDDAEFASNLAMARNDTGKVLETRGDFAAAGTEYQVVRKIFQDLRAREPANARWQSEEAFAWNNLGKLALEQGQLEKAITAYRADQRIKAALTQSDPGNHQWQEDLLVSNAILGRTLGLCGETGAAVHHVEDAVASAQALMAFDPTNADFQDEVARYSQLLGGLLRQQGQFARAATLDGDAVRMLTALLAKDPNNTNTQHDLTQSHLESSRQQLAVGDVDAAGRSAQSALTMIQAALAKQSGDRAWTLLAAQTQTALGQIAAKRNDIETAQRHWAQARDTIAPAAHSGEDPNFLAAWAGTLLLLDDLDAARPLVAKLAAMGYRAADFVALATDRKLPYPQDAELARRIAESTD